MNAWIIHSKRYFMHGSSTCGPIIVVASGHKELQYCSVTTAVKKALRLSFIYFILWNYVLFKVFFIILLTFTCVPLKCTESQYIVVELGNVAWLHVYSQLHHDDYDSSTDICVICFMGPLRLFNFFHYERMSA